MKQFHKAIANIWLNSNILETYLSNDFTVPIMFKILQDQFLSKKSIV